MVLAKVRHLEFHWHKLAFIALHGLVVVKERGLRGIVLLSFGTQTIWRPRDGLIIKEVLLDYRLLFSLKHGVLGKLCEGVGHSRLIFALFRFLEGRWASEVKFHVE